MSPRNTRIRATSDSAIKSTRQRLLRAGHARVNVSIDAGFYLEAIALIESILADRLESAIAYFGEGELEHSTVNQAVRQFQSLEIQFADDDLLEDIANWGRGRSRWIHEFVKVSRDDSLTWDERQHEARLVAEAGSKLLRRLNSELRKHS